MANLALVKWNWLYQKVFFFLFFFYCLESSCRVSIVFNDPIQYARQFDSTASLVLSGVYSPPSQSLSLSHSLFIDIFLSGCFFFKFELLFRIFQISKRNSSGFTICTFLKYVWRGDEVTREFLHQVCSLFQLWCLYFYKSAVVIVEKCQ